jgi:nucleoid DNA-binding protein
MTKLQFVKEFMKKTGILREDAIKIVNAVFDHIRTTLLEGEEVRIDHVGKIVLLFKEAGLVNNNLQATKQAVGARVKLRLRTFPCMQRDLNKRLAKDSK